MINGFLKKVLFLRLGSYKESLFSKRNFLLKRLVVLLIFVAPISTHQAFSSPENSDDRKFILSIDGGGVRGIIPAIILQYIESHINEPLHKKFDIMVGTSTGALLISALSIPNREGQARYTASDIVNMYKTKANKIFKRSFLHSIMTINGWLGPKYHSKYAIRFYKNIFVDSHISETLTHLVIPVLDLRSNKVKFFSSKQSRRRVEEPLHKIVLAATAAPTYFPSVEMTHGYRTYEFIDAGCVVNNPSLCGYIADLFDSNQTTFKKQINHVIVSLGTGRHLLGIKDNISSMGQGKLSWVFRIIDLMMSASSALTSRHSLILFDSKKSLLYGSRNYFRLQVDIPVSCSALDDCSQENIKILETYAYKAIEDNIDKINLIIDLLNNRKNKID